MNKVEFPPGLTLEQQTIWRWAWFESNTRYKQLVNVGCDPKIASHVLMRPYKPNILSRLLSIFKRK